MKLQEVIRNVTGKSHDIKILHLLRDFREKFSSIRETAYLNDFAELKTVNEHNPKYIIRDTLIIYLRSVCDIYKQPNLLQLFTFTYRVDHDHVSVFQYSNFMMFSDDIAIICFIHFMSSDRFYEKCKTFRSLKSLMTNKYEIDIEQKVNDTESSKNKLTLFNIALSYPSIYFEIFIKMKRSKIFNLKEHYNFYCLPDVIFLSSITSLLPTLDEVPPFAILLFIKLNRKIKKAKRLYNTTTGLNLLLDSIYDEYMFYKSFEIFPEGLKLELCEKWQIVEKKNNTYKYTSCFEKYRHKVKDIIAEMKPNDPDLESVLSRL